MASVHERVREDLNAYVDQTLPPRRWEQISYHLAGCEDCRAEMLALCSVRNTLGACRASEAPSSLAARLEQIAGDHADAPLYLAAGQGQLPTSRVARRIAASGAALLTFAVVIVVLAALVAPEPVRIADPVGSAREQFSLSASAVSINEAVGAVLLAYEKGADLGASITYQARGFDGDTHAVTADDAAALLQRATDADVAYSGTQRVWVSDGQGYYRSAAVRVAKQPGEGALLSVLDARGDEFSSSFLPDYISREYEAPEGWSFRIADELETVQGRSAVHLTASEDAVPVAGWWIDSETGILLWTERYDATGDVSLAVGFTSLSFGSADLTSASADLSYSLLPASSSGGDGWCLGLPTCPATLAGLPLVAYSSAERADGATMVLVYSDGFQTAVVGCARGVLEDAAGTVTAVSTSLPSVRAWQYDDDVVTVATNGSTALLEQIAAQLPAKEPYTETLFERVGAGLRRLLPGS